MNSFGGNTTGNCLYLFLCYCYLSLTYPPYRNVPSVLKAPTIEKQGLTVPVYSITFEWSLPTHNKHNLVLSCVFVCLCVSVGVLCVRPFYVPASMCVCVCVWASFAEKSGSTVTEVGCRASSADHCCSAVCLVESASYDLACLRPSPVSCGCERALG